MGMIQAGNSAGFPLEALIAIVVGGEMGRQDLDGHCAIEPRVQWLVDFAHPVGTNQRVDAIGSEPGAWCEPLGGRRRNGRDAY
jgi:hypothetical protein